MSSSAEMSKRAFSELVTCFVINLDSRPDRWKRMQAVCKRHGIEPRRFSAHDSVRGRQTFPQSQLGPSELGIWSSFVTAVQSEVETDWILIFEDDALLLPGFRRQVERYIGQASPDVVTVRLGWLGRFAWRPDVGFVRYCFRLMKAFVRDLRAARRISNFNGASFQRWGAHAVLVRKARVSRLLENLGNAENPLDVALLRAEMTKPEWFTLSKRNLAWQWLSPSDISADRVKRHSKRAKPLG